MKSSKWNQYSISSTKPYLPQETEFMLKIHDQSKESCFEDQHFNDTSWSNAIQTKVTTEIS